MAAGDVITSLDGASVASAEDLGAALAPYQPGDHVRVDWTDIT